MSRWAEQRAGRDRDEGFSLVEVIVALGLFAVVLVVLLPQLLVGLQATTTARMVTQAKGIAQGQLDRMRALPYHVAPDAGEFVDVLDRYYRNRTAPTTSATCASGGGYVVPGTGWAGYVGPTSGARCDYEPATGAFYRSVHRVPATEGAGEFAVVTSTQFLSAATPPTPVTPASGYDSQVTGKDTPASFQLGVTVTVLYADRRTLHPVSTFSQIAQRLPSAPRVDAGADVTTLSVGSVTADGLPLSLSAGLLHLEGSVAYGSTASGTLTATSAGLATGEHRDGASITAAAPPTVTTAATEAGPGALSAGCVYACWGTTGVGALEVSAEQGVPTVGSALTPAQALVTDSANAGVSFGNSSAAAYRPGMLLRPPLLRLDTGAAPAGLSGCSPGGSGPIAYVAAGGYVRTTSDADPLSPGMVETCAVARSAPVEVLPTDFAPRGVVRVVLEHASAHCLVQGASHVPQARYDYRARVEYWNGTTYVTAATVVPGLTSDPLEALPMETPVGGTKTLGDYIGSWSALTVGRVDATESEGAARVKLPAIVTIATQPVRTDLLAPDPTSVMSVGVGALECSAEDAR